MNESALATQLEPSAGCAIEGDLDQLPLAELLQFFHVQGKDGTLCVTDAESRPIAVVYYRSRRIVHAVYRGITGAEAVYAVLSETAGRFFFSMGLAQQPPETVRDSVQNLILEGLRRLDRLQGLVSILPADDQLLYLAPEPPQDDIRLTAMEWRVLSLVNGRRSIRQIVDASGRDEEDVRGVLASLLAADLVVEVKNDAYLDVIVLNAVEVETGSVRYGSATLLGTLILKKIDGQRTLRQLLAELKVEETRILEDLHTLARMGRVGFTRGEEEFRRWVLSQ